MARHDRMTELGILVLHFPPTMIRNDGRQVVAAIRKALSSSRGPPPHIVTVPARRAEAS
jgi:very-short-patch-repair endonuclease